MHDISMKVQEWFLEAGLSEGWSAAAASVLSSFAVAALSAASAILVYLTAIRLLVRKSDGEHHVRKAQDFIRCASFVVFAWVLSVALPDAVIAPAAVEAVASLLLEVAALAVTGAAFSRAVTWLQSVARLRTGDKTFSSKTFAQVAKLVIWSTLAVIISSKLLGKSPAVVLSGLGALTAVLMLIFRDSILGLVAGVQVAQNDMVRIGDWITMPRFNADGNVIDIALTTVKVQNFDNTVTMIPSSALISDAFVNWRYMSQSKGRRIKRAVWINVLSISELSAPGLDGLCAAGLLRPGDRPVSNLAAFELWAGRMLAEDDDISDELTCMVRQTAPTDTGIPVEVYCFTKTRDWVEYEAVQTRIFDLIYVTVPKFGLLVYQRTSDKSLEVAAPPPGH